MRCSLFVPADAIPDRLRSRGYLSVEQQAVAAELAGFSAVWLADQWAHVPPRLPAALAVARQLSVVTDGVDLGLILRLPAPALRRSLVVELNRLDDLSYGRLRVALDLRGLNAAEHDAGLALLEALGERLDVRGAPNPARRLALIADDASAVPAGIGGFGLLLAPGDPLHGRRLCLARYHDAREARPGWAARLLALAPAADEATLVALRRDLPAQLPLLSPASEPTLFGTPEQLIAQLAVAQIADGLDEVVCALAPFTPRSEQLASPVELLGRTVLPHLQAGPKRGAPQRPRYPDL